MTVELKDGKKAEITIKATQKLVKEGEDVLGTTLQFVIRKHRLFVPFVSTGLFYTTLGLNSFGTDTNDMGETIIAESETDGELTSALMFNYVLNLKSPVLPFIQLGVDPVKQRPFLLFGGGLSFPELQLAISGGVAATWTQSLNELSVGDVVDGTAVIQSDISYQFKGVRPYFGLQFNF